MRCLVSTVWELVEIVKRFPFFFRCFHFQNFVLGGFAIPDLLFHQGRIAVASPTPEESEQIPIILVLHNADYMGVSWAHESLEPGCQGGVWMKREPKLREMLTSSYQLVAPINLHFLPVKHIGLVGSKRLSFAGPRW